MTSGGSDLTGKLRVAPTGAALGAEIVGVELTKLSEPEFAVLLDAWARHSVLLIREQRLTDADLVRFSRRFGQLDLCPPNDLGRTHIEAQPEIVVISNVVENGRRIGSLGNYESLWHTDMSFMPSPPKASLLYALEVPATGGETSFCDMQGAYETLPDELKRRIRSYRAIHDASYDSAGNLRGGLPEVADVRQSPGAHHPLVRLHPTTGRPALFLGRRRNAYVVGLPLEESERLLDQLWAHAIRPEHVWTHRWRVGDLVIWDNRCTMHRREAFPADSRRVMHRTQVKGEEVMAA
jgi:taurine dioxygenase